MADATKVKLGVCEVTFSGTNLGYTKGGVQFEYTTESIDVEVDQEDAPINSFLTGQTAIMTVPLAEENFTVLQDLLPGATLTTDGNKEKLELSGAAGISLSDMEAELVVNPSNDDANSNITFHHAQPTPTVSFSYDKENVRVWTVTFKAVKGSSGFVTFGDTTAT